MSCLLIASRHIAVGAYSKLEIHTQHGCLANVVVLKDHVNVVVLKDYSFYFMILDTILSNKYIR